MRDLAIEQERQVQLAKDAAAFSTLSSRRQAMAVSLAKAIFWGCQTVINLGKSLMAPVDWLFDNSIRTPFIAVKNAAASLFRKWFKPAASKESKPANDNSVWSRIKKSVGAFTKKTANFFEYHVVIGLYRATEWALNPRTRSGKPLFGNKKTLNKIAGAIGAACIFVGLSFGFGLIEIMAKVWHVQLTKVLLSSTAPWLVSLGQQAVFHTLLSWGLAAVQLLIVPSIAAARQTLKSVKFIQGVSCQYKTMRRAHRAGQKPKEASEKRSLTSLITKFLAEVIEKTSPEFYKARLKHFQAQRRQERQKKSTSLQRQAPKAAKDLRNLELDKAFNDNAAPKSAPPNNAAPPKILPKQNFRL